MAHLNWSVLCRRSIVDRDDNSISLLDAVEEVTLGEEVPESAFADGPAVLSYAGPGQAVMQLVSHWSRDEADVPEEQGARVSVLDPRGKTLLEKKLTIDLKSYRRSRQKVSFQGIMYTGPGTYRYEIHRALGEDWDLAACVLLEVYDQPTPVVKADQSE